MPNLYYQVKLIGSAESIIRDFRLPSQHSFPSPIGTLFRFIPEDGSDVLFFSVCYHLDDYLAGNFYMQLDLDQSGDPWNIEPDNVEDIIGKLVAQGWEEHYKTYL